VRRLERSGFDLKEETMTQKHYYPVMGPCSVCGAPAATVRRIRAGLFERLCDRCCTWLRRHTHDAQVRRPQSARR